MIITLEISDGAISILFNKQLHLLIKEKEFVGLQSWFTDDKPTKYFIEFYLKTGKIKCEYTCIGRWKQVLELFNKYNIFNIK